MGEYVDLGRVDLAEDSYIEITVVPRSTGPLVEHMHVTGDSGDLTRFDLDRAREMRDLWASAVAVAEGKPLPSAAERQEERDERAATIAGLREMADWLEAHPELPLRRYTSGLVLSHFVDDHDELERLAAAFGVEPDPRTDNPHPGNPHRYARKTFGGGVEVEAVICNAYPEPAAVDTSLAPAGQRDPHAVGVVTPERQPLTDEQIDGALVELVEVLDANPELLAEPDAETDAPLRTGLCGSCDAGLPMACTCPNPAGAS